MSHEASASYTSRHFQTRLPAISSYTNACSSLSDYYRSTAHWMQSPRRDLRDRLPSPTHHLTGKVSERALDEHGPSFLHECRTRTDGNHQSYQRTVSTTVYRLVQRDSIHFNTTHFCSILNSINHINIRPHRYQKGSIRALTSAKDTRMCFPLVFSVISRRYGCMYIPSRGRHASLRFIDTSIQLNTCFFPFCTVVTTGPSSFWCCTTFTIPSRLRMMLSYVENVSPEHSESIP